MRCLSGVWGERSACCSEEWAQCFRTVQRVVLTNTVNLAGWVMLEYQVRVTGYPVWTTVGEASTSAPTRGVRTHGHKEPCLMLLRSGLASPQHTYKMSSFFLITWVAIHLSFLVIHCSTFIIDYSTLVIFCSTLVIQSSTFIINFSTLGIPFSTLGIHLSS